MAACDSANSLQGNGDGFTETRTVSDFDKVNANNGVNVILTVDPTATGDVDLEVTTDSNLQEFLTTRVSGSKLTASSNRQVTPTQGWDVSGSVAALKEVSADDGAEVNLTGSVDEVTLKADNGGLIDGEDFKAATVKVDADNGAKVTVCVTGEITGDATNGAEVTVLCGGSMQMHTSGGGKVSSAP